MNIGLRLLLGRFAFGVALAIFGVQVSYANCVEFDNVFSTAPDELGFGKIVFFQLERGEAAKHLILHNPSTSGDAGTLSWKFFTVTKNQKPPFCLQSEGRTIEPLMSLHDSKFPDRFGMPGSGFPRCSNSIDPLGSFKLRAWANRELGDSLVLAMTEAVDSSPQFTLLLSKIDGAWVIVYYTGDGTSCYYDRGDNWKSASMNRN